MRPVRGLRCYLSIGCLCTCIRILPSARCSAPLPFLHYTRCNLAAARNMTRLHIQPRTPGNAWVYWYFDNHYGNFVSIETAHSVRYASEIWHVTCTLPNTSLGPLDYLIHALLSSSHPGYCRRTACPTFCPLSCLVQRYMRRQSSPTIAPVIPSFETRIHPAFLLSNL